MNQSKIGSRILTRPEKILILTNTIRSGTGGFASILEMAQGFTLIPNVQVQFAILRMDPSFSKYLRILRSNPQNEAISFLYYPGFRSEMFLSGGNSDNQYGFWELVFNLFKSHTKQAIRELLEYLAWKRNPRRSQKLIEVLERSDVILKAMGLTGQELTFIKKTSTAMLLQNHAGSPETYEKYWLRDEHIMATIDPELPRYVRFCLAFDKILFQSPVQAKECASRHPALPDRVLTLQPTCDERVAERAMRQESPYGKEQFVIVNVGVLSPRKAQLESIEAFANIAGVHPKIHLYILGNTQMWSDYYKDLCARVKSLDLEDRVHFLGHRGDYLKYMAHADCMVQTSRGEGVSRVLREAMFMKLPVVSYAIPGTADLLEGEKEALLVDPGDVKGISSALDRLISNDALRLELAEGAYKSYLSKHSNQVYLKNLESLLSSLHAVQDEEKDREF